MTEHPGADAFLGSLEEPGPCPGERAGAGLGGTLVLGMPHLSGTGLSEQWLLKECGHRHWQMLAAAAGQTVPRFVAPDGAPIYAAFTGITVEAAGFSACQEHDTIGFHSRLARHSRSRVFSDHLIGSSDGLLGRVGMTSAFIRRTRAGENASVVRAEVPGLPTPYADPAAAAHAAKVAALAADPAEGQEMDDEGGRAIGTADFVPCPSLDFNGAGFLYFAAYVAFADRAEWQMSRATAGLPLLRRTLRFFGNVDPGDAIRVHLRRGPSDGPGLRAVEARVFGSGRLLAVIGTERRAGTEPVPAA